MENIVEQVPQINTEMSQSIEKPKKKFPLALLIIALLLIGILVTIFILGEDRNEENPEQDDEQTEKEVDSDFIDADGYDVSNFTDIKLKSYEGLVVMVSKEDEADTTIIPGVIYYGQEAYYFNPDGLTYKERITEPLTSMSIVNRSSTVSTVQEIAFDETVTNIQNKNVDSQWLDSGTLQATRLNHYSANYTFIQELTNVTYPNTESVFAVLLFGGSQEAPYVNDDGTNFSIVVFAVKGENVIQLQATGKTLTNLGITLAEHESCTEEVSAEDSDLVYNLDCLSEIIKLEKYQTEVRKITDSLVSEFELVQ